MLIVRGVFQDFRDLFFSNLFQFWPNLMVVMTFPFNYEAAYACLVYCTVHWINIYSVSKRNDYQEYLLRGIGSRWVRPTIFSHSYADFLEILEASTSCIFNGLPKPVMGQLSFFLREIITRFLLNSYMPTILHYLSISFDAVHNTYVYGIIC
jgi:hypothetical protein